MTRILQINSSLNGADGQSSRLADAAVNALLDRNPQAEVTVRDLAREPVPHLDAATFTAFATKPEDRTEAQRAAVALSDALIAELHAADVLVLGLPMYNFGVPSTLKAWIDHIARAGETFRYTENGPVGLLPGKQAYVASARGGRYAGTPNDFETGYVRQFLGFIGIEDVTFVHAEGLALGDDARRDALAAAHEVIEQLRVPDTQAA